MRTINLKVKRLGIVKDVKILDFDFARFNGYVVEFDGIEASMKDCKSNITIGSFHRTIHKENIVDFNGIDTLILNDGREIVILTLRRGTEKY